MRARILGLWLGVTILLVALAAWLFQWSLEKATLLAPVIVATAGATAFIVVLWAKVVWESLRRSGHPVAIVVGIVAAFCLLLALSFVIDLPDYHH